MSPLLANRYEILRELGHGAMGVVWAVRDTLDQDRELALKAIRHEGGVTERDRLRFKEEFRAMARLHHPNTVAVYDFGWLDAERHYLTMELVPGRELAEIMAKGPQPPAEAYPLLLQLLQALGFIHGRGYLHRDIKPQNIRVTDTGTLKLMDFGLMVPAGFESNRQITGTVGYLAPEVVTGGALGPGADLYAVGCLAYELLSGRLPFTGALGEVVRAHVSRAPEPLRRHAPAIPEALDRIVMRLLAKDPRDRHARAEDVIADLAALAGLAVARESDDQQASYLRAGLLVGREHERDTLEQALADAREGRGGAVLIGAPAGTGKSRLLQELVLHAKLEGVAAVHGECAEVARVPYQAVAQALKPLLAHADDDDKAAHAEAIEGLHAAFQGQAPDADLRDVIARALAALSERRTLLWVMEDLHWADAQTLALFHHCARLAGASRLLLVGTVRDDEIAPGSALFQAVEEGAMRFLKLGPLSREQQARLIDAMLPGATLSDDFAEALYAATGGNPFFLTEMLRALLEERLIQRRDGAWHLPLHAGVLGPLCSLESTIERRVSHLSPGARALAAAAAVLGPHPDLDGLLAVSCLDEDAFFPRLEELVDRQFIHRDDAGYAFPHSRLRETLYAGLSPEDRRALHQRAGEHLERIHADDPAAALHALAHHFGHGHDAERAHRYGVAAGDAAEAAGADAIALDCWRLADEALDRLDATDKPALQKALWQRIVQNGLVLTPRATMAALDKLIAMGGDPREQGTWYSMLAAVRSLLGDARGGLEAAEAAAALAPADEPVWRGALSSAAALPYLLQGRFDEMLTSAREAERLLAEGDLARYPFGVRVALPRVLGIQLAGIMQGLRPDPELRERALAAAAAIGDHTPLLGPSLFGLHAAWNGDLEAAQRYIDDTLRLCRQLGAPPYPMALYLQPYLTWQRGDFASALAQVEKALGYPHMAQMRYLLHAAETLKGVLLVELGRGPEAEAIFAALEAEGEAQGMHMTLQDTWLGQGRAALAAGDRARARARFERALSDANTGPGRNMRMAMRAHLALGRLATEERRFADAGAHLTGAGAIATAPDTANAYEEAQILLARSALEAARGDQAAAERTARAAGTIFHRLGQMHGLHLATVQLETLAGQAEAEREDMALLARWRFMGGGV